MSSLAPARDAGLVARILTLSVPASLRQLEIGPVILSPGCEPARPAEHSERLLRRGVP